MFAFTQQVSQFLRIEIGKFLGVIQKHTKWSYGAVLLLAAVTTIGVFGIAPSAHAIDFGANVARLLGWIIYGLLIWPIGQLVVLTTDVVIWVASYNDFFNNPAVQIGWPLVRDLANMFFIVVLLLIAIGTIFDLEEYHYSNLLPKILLAAILINFSKTITGFFIDIGQVIMLTFVNAFRDIMAGNIAQTVGLDKLLSFREVDANAIGETGEAPGFFSVLGSLLLAAIMLIITFLVLIAMLVVLVFRIIMLWILIVLSPLPWILQVIPVAEEYASKWWSELGKYVISGPILAFFLWLTFSITSTFDSNGASALIKRPENRGDKAAFESNDETKAISEVSGFASQAGTSGHFLSFVIGIGLLLGSLMLTGELGVMGGKFAQGIAEKVQELPLEGLKLGAENITDRIHAAGGPQLNPMIWIEQIKEHMAEQHEKRYAAGLKRARGRFEKGGRINALWGFAMAPREAMEYGPLTSWKGFKSFVKGGHSEAMKAAAQAAGLRARAAERRQLYDSPWQYQGQLESEIKEMEASKLLLENERTVVATSQKSLLNQAGVESDVELAAKFDQVRIDQLAIRADVSLDQLRNGLVDDPTLRAEIDLLSHNADFQSQLEKDATDEIYIRAQVAGLDPQTKDKDKKAELAQFAQNLKPQIQQRLLREAAIKSLMSNLSTQPIDGTDAQMMRPFAMSIDTAAAEQSLHDLNRRIALEKDDDQKQIMVTEKIQLGTDLKLRRAFDEVDQTTDPGQKDKLAITAVKAWTKERSDLALDQITSKNSYYGALGVKDGKYDKEKYDKLVQARSEYQEVAQRAGQIDHELRMLDEGAPMTDPKTGAAQVDAQGNVAEWQVMPIAEKRKLLEKIKQNPALAFHLARREGYQEKVLSVLGQNVDGAAFDSAVRLTGEKRAAKEQSSTA